MSNAKTALKVTKRVAKAPTKKKAPAKKAPAKKAAASKARNVEKATPRSTARVSGVAGSGKTGAYLRKALKVAIDEPLAEAIEEIGADRATIDLIVTRKDESDAVVETKVPPAGPKGALKQIRSMSLETVVLELIPDWEGEKFGYRLIRHDPEPLRTTTSELADRMLPEAQIPSPAQALLAQGESEARWGLLQEFGALTSEEIADRRSRAKNRHAIANRWRSEEKIFGVEARGRRVFPGFQFDGESLAPEPIVAQVLAALPREEMSEWETALWWVAADPWLEGRRPVDLMHEDPGAVLDAASALARPMAL